VSASGVAASAAALACVGLTAGTAAARDDAARPLRLVPVASGFRAPVYVTAPRSEPGRLYVVEQAGVVRVVSRGSVVARPFLDLRSRVRVTQLQGLLSLAFHPRYASNRRFYVLYTGRRGNVYVVELRSSRGRAVLRSARVILRAKASPHPLAHVGGHLAFGPDGRLYAGVGDGLVPEAAQDLASPLGKILRIDVERPDRSPEVAAYGLRNPWRFSFDRLNGDLYVGDVGDLRWEEVNYVRPRRGFVPNFGWSAYEGRQRVSWRPITAREALMFPIAAYRHARRGCSSVIGGYVYRGVDRPQARGRFVYGDLCSGRVWSLRVARGRATERRAEPVVVPRLLSSFGEDARGELYAVSLAGGTIYRLAD
jgi:glucose/arabinose dehydrogenase